MRSLIAIYVLVLLAIYYAVFSRAWRDASESDEREATLERYDRYSLADRKRAMYEANKHA